MAAKKELRTVTDEKVEATVRSLAEVNSKLEALADLKKTLQDRLLDLLAGESAKVGELEVIVKAGSRSLDARLLEQTYPAAENPAFYTTETKLDVKKVRERIAPADLAAFLKEPGASSVTLK